MMAFFLHANYHTSSRVHWKLCFFKFWKRIKIILVKKTEHCDQCSNYRSIAITSYAYLLMERIVCRQVTFSLHDNFILFASLYGLLPGRFIVTSGIEYLDVVTISLDRRMCIDAVYLDYSKTFDTAPHSLQELQKCEIGGCFLSWISDYLHGRNNLSLLRTQKPLFVRF